MTATKSQVIQHVVDSITPASRASAAAARAALHRAGTPVLENLGAALASAQHTSRPRTERRVLVIAAGDHGCGDPGIAMGADHPTIVAARAIADGSAAVCDVARPTPIVVVDAGAREPTHMPSIAIALGRGPTRDLLREPAQTVVDAVLGLEAGIALAMSLHEPPLESSPRLAIVGVGAIGVGAEVASAAIVGAVLGAPVSLGERDEAAELAMRRGVELNRTAGPGGVSGLELLAHFGGSETAVLAGLMLACASLNTAIVLDGHATGTAALVAATLAPDVRGYLVAAQRGTFTMPAIVEHLGLAPAFELGLGHGEGTGAAMALPLLDQAAALVARG